MTCNPIEDAAEAGHPKTKDVWLLLLKEGGRWGVGEIAGALGCEASNQFRAIFPQMLKYGYVTRFPNERGTRFQYAVTPACRVPMGIEVRELAGAVPA